MPLVNTPLLKTIPEHVRESFVYYPDVLLFEHDRGQFLSHWRTLSQSRYIYSNGYEIKPAHWFRYAFESFKGWFGFTNHCRTELIVLSLQKFAYYGYLNGYTQSNRLSDMRFYPLESGVLDEVSKLLNDGSTQYLQDTLIRYYTTFSNYFNPDKSYHLDNKHAFGSSWVNVNQWNVIPGLDPQDQSLINRTVNALKVEYNKNINYHFIPSSRYACAVAQQCIKQAPEKEQGTLSKIFGSLGAGRERKLKTQYYLNLALRFDPNCYLEALPVYIDFCIEKEDFKQAYVLITKLADVQLDLAVNYLIKDFSDEQRRQLVIKDSVLAQGLARHHLQQSGNLKNIVKASQYVSKMEDPSKEFTLKVSQQHFDKAYAVFEQHYNKVTFSQNSLNELSKHFVGLGERFYDTGKAHRESKNWDEARKFYFDSMMAMQKAHKLTPCSEIHDRFLTHQRLYAQLLIDIDKHQHSTIDSNARVISKAIEMLQNCCEFNSEHDFENKYRTEALANGLMRRVDCLLYKIAVTNSASFNYAAQKAHKQAHQAEFTCIVDSLQRVIKLLEHWKNQKFKQILGKAHFILADMKMYFDLDEDYNDHFKKAYQLVPNNPFYLLRGSEVFESEKDKLKDQGLLRLTELGYTTFDYIHWDEQRWEQGESTYGSIHTIHDLKEPVQTGSSYSFRT